MLDYFKHIKEDCKIRKIVLNQALDIYKFKVF